jgi:O-antigen/teichoic acid export membrane protein
MTESSAVDRTASGTAGAAVARSGLWNLASTAVPQLYVIAVSIAAARYLGASNFGRQSFIAFVALSLATLLTAGLPTTLTRYIGDAVGRGDRGTLAGLLRWSWRVEAVAAVLGSVALVCVALAGATPRAAWLFAAVSVAAQVLVRVPNSFLNGLHRWREPSIIALAVGFVAMCATIVVLALGGGISGMFAVEAIAGVTMLAAMAWIARRFHPVGIRPRLNRKQLSPVIRYSLLASAGVVLTLIVYRRSEFLFLAHYSSDAQIALYSVGFAAVAALLLISQPLVGVALPAVATLWGAGSHDRIRSGYGRANRLLLLFTLPVTAAALALGPETLRLVYGPEFSSIGPVLLILLAPLPLYSVMSLSNVVLAGIGRLGFPLVAGAVAAGVNIGLDFVLIPSHGAIGAAIANSTAQLMAGLPVLVYTQRLIGLTAIQFWPVARVAMASAIAGLVAWLMLQWLGGATGVVAGLAAGAAAFAVLASLLRILVPEDASWLAHVGGVRLAPAARGLARWWAPRQG